MGISKAVIEYLTRDPPPDEPITFRGVEWNVNGTMKSCIFCEYAAKTKEKELLFEDDLVVAFSPPKKAAKQHLLVLPKRHIGTIGDLISGDAVVLDRMRAVAQDLLKCGNSSNTQFSFHVPPWNSIGEALLGASPGHALTRPCHTPVVVVAYQARMIYTAISHLLLLFNFIRIIRTSKYIARLVIFKGRGYYCMYR